MSGLLSNNPLVAALLAAAAAEHSKVHGDDMPALKAAAYKRQRPLVLSGVKHDDFGVRHLVRADGSTHGRRWNGRRHVKYPANGHRP